jgi:hypothetical protein
LTKDGIQGGGLNVVPLSPPPQKKQSAIGIGERGGQDAQKGRAGDAIITRWMMTMTMMTTMMMVAARGGSKGRSINDSIS